MNKTLRTAIILLIAHIMFFYNVADARLNRYTVSNKAKYFNDSCLEIGRTAVYPKVCKSPTKVMYKGIYCYGCPEASRCSPACTGGKVCINQRCLCPPNRLLVDCNGKCQDPTVPCNIP